jgi:hypothetical protein
MHWFIAAKLLPLCRPAITKVKKFGLFDEQNS